MPRYTVELDGRNYFVDFNRGGEPEAVRVEIPATPHRAVPWARVIWGRFWGISPRGKARRALELARDIAHMGALAVMVLCEAGL